jgi:hypothetical protein
MKNLTRKLTRSFLRNIPRNTSRSSARALGTLSLALLGGWTGCATSHKTSNVNVGSSPAGMSERPARGALGVMEAQPDLASSGAAEAQPPLLPMPIISFGLPAHASSGNAGDANDRSYDTQWRSTENTSPATPSWIAYDLSSVPPPKRGQVDVVWYNGNGGYAEYDTFAQAGGTYNQPRDYDLEANAAPGGTPPASGWVTLATVKGNTYVSREHDVNLAGYNWLRMKVTAINGTSFNENTAINLDVHDASHGISDSWLFLGDSITAFAMRNDGAGIGAKSFSELINASKPAYFPAAQGAGEGGWNSGTPLSAPSPDGKGSIFDHWLSTFPGNFVCLSYGTNDGADGSGDATSSYEHLVTMVKKVLAAGKTPCIPTVPWAQDEAHQKNAKLVNAKIELIYGEFPQVVKGPDLWTALLNQTELYQDDLHPNPQGREAYRQAWAKTVLATVYP